MKSLLAAVLLFFAGLFGPHHTATIQATHAPTQATPTPPAPTQTAAVLNAALASQQPTTTTVASTPPTPATQTGAASKPQLAARHTSCGSSATATSV